MYQVNNHMLQFQDYTTYCSNYSTSLVVVVAVAIGGWCFWWLVVDECCLVKGPFCHFVSNGAVDVGSYDVDRTDENLGCHSSWLSFVIFVTASLHAATTNKISDRFPLRTWRCVHQRVSLFARASSRGGGESNEKLLTSQKDLGALGENQIFI